MDANSVDDFIGDFFVSIQDLPIAIVGPSGDDENLMAFLLEPFGHIGDGELLGIVELADDEDFHWVNYLRFSSFWNEIDKSLLFVEREIRFLVV